MGNPHRCSTFWTRLHGGPNPIPPSLIRARPARKELLAKRFIQQSAERQALRTIQLRPDPKERLEPSSSDT